MALYCALRPSNIFVGAIGLSNNMSISIPQEWEENETFPLWDLKRLVHTRNWMEEQQEIDSPF